MPQAPRVSGLRGVARIGSLAGALFTNVVGRLAGGKKLPERNPFRDDSQVYHSIRHNMPVEHKDIVGYALCVSPMGGSKSP